MAMQDKKTVGGRRIMKEITIIGEIMGEQMIQKQQQKINRINETLMSIEDRCKFVIKK